MPWASSCWSTPAAMAASVVCLSAWRASAALIASVGDWLCVSPAEVFEVESLVVAEGCLPWLALLLR